MTELTLQSESVLARANQRLARLTGIAPAPLATGGGQALADTLWIWGIVGGKDVGKSTLINALAGGDVVDRGVDVGAGTDAPSAYLHARDRVAAEQRFAGQAVRYVADAPAGLRGLVLVDLPDFDSLFAEHLARVRDIVHALDGIIWVTTPKKIGDLRAIEEIQRMLKAG
jgi:GTPase SAR1 family protein